MDEKENPFSYKSANDATGFLLWKVHNCWQREIKKSLKQLDLTHTQFVILAGAYWLSLNQVEVTQVEIARHAQTDVMMTSNVLRILEKKGFVNRAEHKTDTRAKVIHISEKGRKVLVQAVKTVETFDRRFFSALDNETGFNRELIRLMEAC